MWVNDPEKKIQTKEQMQEHLQKQVWWFRWPFLNNLQDIFVTEYNADMGRVGVMDENPVSDA